MINEEGGVDPEQFRMEAMFDRMDAIGKGVLGLTIQCAQCHTHKFDPLTQEEYYRMFAFLNNAHEANVAVYTPDEQKTRAELFRQIREIEDDLQHRHARLGRADGRRGKRQVAASQPEWTVVAAGGRRHLDGRPEVPADARRLVPGPGLRADQAPVEDDGAGPTCKDITAFRLELLNDPNLPLGGPGRSIKGTGALTEFEVEAAPADAPEQDRAGQVRQGHGRRQPARDAARRRSSTTRAASKRVTGPVAFAIDGKDETAWGIDAGPGRRNVPRKAVFVAEKPIAFPAGTILTFNLKQNHGGWNSDDNQNNNLGRFRLSVTDRAGRRGRPAARRPSARSSAIPRDRRTPAQAAAVFSYWRTTVPEWKEANDRIEALWKQHPEGATQLVLAGARDAAR